MTDPAAPRSAVPDGMTVYAIGDIHGRAELLEGLLASLALDSQNEPEPPTLIFLGDYIDRGPESRRVIDLILDIPPETFKVIPLLGNHESAMLEFLRDPTIGEPWAGHGGAETLASYGVQVPKSLADIDWADLSDALQRKIPYDQLQFLESLRLNHVVGDYFFCHAGVRPGVALDAQSEEDLLWIRNEFLDDDSPFEKVIVHGHTPELKIHSDNRRIGLDTGAYTTGVLTAVRLRGSQRTFFNTEPRVRTGAAPPAAKPAAAPPPRAQTQPPQPPPIFLSTPPPAPNRPPLAEDIAHLIAIAQKIGAQTMSDARTPAQIEASRAAIRRAAAELQAMAVATAPDRAPAPAPPADSDAKILRLGDELGSDLGALGVMPSVLLNRGMAAAAIAALARRDPLGARQEVHKAVPATIVRLRRAIRDDPSLWNRAQHFVASYVHLVGAGGVADGGSPLAGDMERLFLLLDAALAD